MEVSDTETNSFSDICGSTDDPDYKLSQGVYMNHINKLLKFITFIFISGSKLYSSSSVTDEMSWPSDMDRRVFNGNLNSKKFVN